MCLRLYKDSRMASRKSTSPFLIPPFVTFLLTSLKHPSEKHKVLNLLAPFLMDCFSLPFWDYAKTEPLLEKGVSLCTRECRYACVYVRMPKYIESIEA